MLDPYTNYNGIFVEITKSEHGHGGPGWEFGTCLWSPTRNQAGHDRYALMREPVRGSLVLHAYHDHWPEGATETRICGQSIVSQPHKEVIEEPPSPGSWAGMSPYYRIDLEGYEQFATPLPISRLLHDYGGDIRYDLKENQPGYYPFATYRDTVRTVQGIYLARCTVGLYQIIGHALGIQESLTSTPESGVEPLTEYTESRRLSHERYFFARNSKLIKAAKDHYGAVCQACRFEYRSKYGELGDGYIEVHHLDPLSERPELEWSEQLRTSIGGVTVLCADCHRMIHRKRPALSLQELRETIAKTGD